MTEQNVSSEQPLDLHIYPPSRSILPISHSSPTEDSTTCTSERRTLHGKQQRQQNLISEQPLGLHPYPPSSSNLQISHSDIGIGSAEDSESTKEPPTHHGLWDVTNETQRGMQSRHLTMIAIGGTLGTGIFLSAGSSVSTCGPGGALISYCILGLFVYAMMIILGEMSSMYPVSGAFSTFGTRFVSPALGFTIGWNYWLQWSLSIPGELTAASVILHYWTPSLQPWQWAIIFTVPTFAFQLIHVRAYGESEYWFSMIKVIMVILFIIVGLIYDWGGIKDHPGPGLSNFRNGQAFVGGISAFATNLPVTLFSFGGVELVAVAAGESSKPYKSVPRATKATFFRIVFFYILTILTIGLCINRNDPTLLNANSKNDASTSPVTTVFIRAGFGLATHVVNAVLLTAVLSVTNSCYYASSRMLLALARSGQAPRIFGRVTERGVPVPALLVALAFSFLTLLTNIWKRGVVVTWLIKTIGLSTLITWTSIGVISIRFRQAYKAQDRSLSDLPYRQPLYPWLPIGVIVLGVVMCILPGYSSVIQKPVDYREIIAMYAIIALCIILFCGFILYERVFEGKTKHFIPKSEVDLSSFAVWGPGEGERIRAQDLEESKNRKPSIMSALIKVLTPNFLKSMD